MRTLIATLTIGLLSMDAYAQSNPSLTTSRGQRSGYHYKEMKPRYLKDMDEELKDRSYREALKSIPDSKNAPDPWKDAR